MPLIFLHATQAVIWFNDIPCWSVLPKAVAWLSLNYMSFAGGKQFDETSLAGMLQSAFEDDEAPIEFFDGLEAIGRHAWFRNPKGWFESMWGLQEALVRPEILLCDINLVCLEVASGIPVAFNDIAALLDAITTKTMPQSVKELSQFFRELEYGRLLDLDSETGVISMRDTSLGREYHHCKCCGRFHEYTYCSEMLEKAQLESLLSYCCTISVKNVTGWMVPHANPRVRT